MRVLYLLTDGFGKQGGIAQFNRDLLKAICSNPDVSELVAFPRHAGQHIQNLPAKLRYDVRSAAGKLRYAISVITWLLERQSVDLIVCTHLNLQPLAALARLMTGAPSIMVLHGVEAWRPPSSLIRRLAVRYADWVVAVSRHTLTRFLEWASVPSERGIVMPCCVDMARFAPGLPARSVLDKYHVSKAATVVLSLGRLAGTERYKGFDELLEALGQLRAAHPDILCVIAGSGDDGPRLARKACELGVSEYTRFTGSVPDSELVDLYRTARTFVLAGYGEGFGIVLLEAMACGIPVVASVLDGSFEAIRGGELGIAVDPRDRDSLVDGISTALRRPRGVRPVGLENFSYEAFETRVNELLARATGGRSMLRP